MMALEGPACGVANGTNSEGEGEGEGGGTGLQDKRWETFGLGEIWWSPELAT